MGTAIMELPAALKDNYLFRGMTPTMIDTVIGLAQVREFKGGDVLVRQFDRKTDLMIILKGQVRIKTFSGETVADLGPGTVVGEISLIDAEPRSATVVSLGDSEVAVIPASELVNLMNRDVAMKAQFLQNLSILLCQRLRAANIQLDGALAHSR